MTNRRFFNGSERAALYLAADGRCTGCGAELQPGWHADHEKPHSAGGPTDVINGQALCPACNLKKGSSVTVALRTWQQEALDVISSNPKPDYLMTATPGAGKTTFALATAKMMLHEGTVTRVVVVVPTDSLRLQWADAAAAVGLQLMPVNGIEGYDKAGYVGCVLTYAQLAVGAGRDLLRRTMRQQTLAILDEVHHAGDNRSWGEGLQYGVELAKVRLSLTGTPWRKDPKSPIPFVEYDQDGRVVVDYAYEYGVAVADGVCRRLEFYAWDGEAKWIDHMAPEKSRNRWSRLGSDLAEVDVAPVLEGLYSPNHQWMPAVLSEADRALRQVREEVPDAAAMVIAADQGKARAYAKLLKQITGTDPAVVVSDEDDAKDIIDRFRHANTPWLVAVKMVSEGVDIPRLVIGVYASTSKTPLFFRQVAGRFVRTRRNEEVNAKLFIPAVPVLMDHARDIEDELRHQLEVETERADAEPFDRSGASDQGEFELRTIVSAGDAEFNRAIVAGEEVSPAEYSEAAGIAQKFGIGSQYVLNLAQVLRQERGSAAPVALPTVTTVVEKPRHRQESMLRDEIKALVGRLAYRRKVNPREVNADLLRQGHKPRDKAPVEDLEKAKDTIIRWLGEL